MTTGGLLVARVAMKPLATLNRPVLQHRRRRDQGGDGLVQGAHRRHRGARPSGVVAETMVALVLADEVTAQVRRRLAAPSSCATTPRTSRRSGDDR